MIRFAASVLTGYFGTRLLLGLVGRLYEREMI